MKKYLIHILICLPLLLVGQKKEKIKGSGLVKMETKELKEFNSIVLDHDIDIQVYQSGSNFYELEADDNFIAALELKIEKKTLLVGSSKAFSGGKEFNLRINAKELANITVYYGSITSGTTINSDTISLKTYNNGKLELQVNAGETKVYAEDKSKIELGLNTVNLDIAQRERATVAIQALGLMNKANIGLYDRANLTVEGAVTRIDLTTRENAHAKLKKFKSDEAMISVEESSITELYALNLLKLKSIGNAKTYLYGEPKIEIDFFLDTSQLIKKKVD